MLFATKSIDSWRDLFAGNRRGASIEQGGNRAEVRGWGSAPLTRPKKRALALLSGVDNVCTGCAANTRSEGSNRTQVNNRGKLCSADTT